MMNTLTNLARSFDRSGDLAVRSAFTVALFAGVAAATMFSCGFFLFVAADILDDGMTAIWSK